MSSMYAPPEGVFFASLDHRRSGQGISNNTRIIQIRKYCSLIEGLRVVSLADTGGK